MELDSAAAKVLGVTVIRGGIYAGRGEQISAHKAEKMPDRPLRGNQNFGEPDAGAGIRRLR